MLTTLCVELQEATALLIEVAFAEAAPDPVVRDGCVEHAVVYVGIVNPALAQSMAREESRNLDQFCA
jgi:hypothetical protein